MPPPHSPKQPQAYVPEEKLAEVQRVLYGANMGAPVAALPLPEAVAAAAEGGGLDVKAFAFGAAAEQLRPPRVMRVGLIQNSIKLPTDLPYLEQREVREGGPWPWLPRRPWSCLGHVYAYAPRLASPRAP